MSLPSLLRAAALLGLLSGSGCSFLSKTGDDDDDDDDDESDSDTDSDTDSDSDSDSDTDTDTDTTTIPQVQRETYAVGTVVTVSGIVAGSETSSGFFVLDPAGGRNGGLWVFLDGVPLPGVVEGDEVTITGSYEEYTSGAGSLTELVVSRPADIVIDGHGAALPAPVVVDTATLANSADAEPYEATLLSVRDVTVSNANAPGNTWTIDDEVVVSELFYAPANVTPGQGYTSITGILNFASGFQIAPRYAADLELGPTSSCGASLCVGDLRPGDLVITELMSNPDACDDNYCEWIEVLNVSGQSVDLIGLVVRDSSARDGTIDVPVVLPANAYAVLGKSDAASWASTDLLPDAWYGGSVSLVNSGTAYLEIVNPTTGIVVDTTASWGDGGVGNREGVAWQLDRAHLNATDNDRAEYWCDATRRWASSDYGSPGAANAACP